MARARNIKPGFFKNELLIELGAFDRLLFVGLWCLADREGRIEDRPKRIKLELFPCDTYDVDAGLNELARCGFIKRYEINGISVVSIANFLKHQTPHGTEKDSELPDENGTMTQHERVNGYVTGQKRANNVKSEANNRQSPLDNSARTVIAPLDNTLNPDSLNPEVDICTNVHRLASKTPYQQLIDLYHDKCSYLPKVTVVNDSRKRAMKARFSEVMKTEKWTEEQTISWFGEYYGIVNQSKFLTGRAAASNGHRPFKADWDWIHNPNNFVKVVEGKYNGG